MVVTGSAKPLTEPYVATLAPVANIAVGDETPWGVAAELAELLPGTGAGVYPEGSCGGDVLAAAGDRTVVAVVRDAHRHPWMTEVLDALVAARPDTVVVEMGLPGRIPAEPSTSRRTARPASAAGPRRKSSRGRSPAVAAARSCSPSRRTG